MGAGRGQIKRVNTQARISAGRTAQLPKVFKVIEERILRHENTAENKDREYRVLIIYNSQTHEVRIQRYWGRWGKNLQTIQSKENEVGSINKLPDLVWVANELVRAKKLEGYEHQGKVNNGTLFGDFLVGEARENIQLDSDDKEISDEPINVEAGADELIF